MIYLKVSKFQNEYMKWSFLPNYEPKIVRISALGRVELLTMQFLVHILGETTTSWIYSEIYWPLASLCTGFRSKFCSMYFFRVRFFYVETKQERKLWRYVMPSNNKGGKISNSIFLFVSFSQNEQKDRAVNFWRLYENKNSFGILPPLKLKVSRSRNKIVEP